MRLEGNGVNPRQHFLQHILVVRVITTMILSIDDSVGRVMESLRERKALDCRPRRHYGFPVLVVLLDEVGHFGRSRLADGQLPQNRTTMCETQCVESRQKFGRPTASIPSIPVPDTCSSGSRTASSAWYIKAAGKLGYDGLGSPSSGLVMI